MLHDKKDTSPSLCPNLQWDLPLLRCSPYDEYVHAASSN